MAFQGPQASRWPGIPVCLSGEQTTGFTTTCGSALSTVSLGPGGRCNVAKVNKVITDQTTEFKRLLANANVVCRKCRFRQLAQIADFSFGTGGHYIKHFNCLNCGQLNFDLFKGTRWTGLPSPAFNFVTVMSFPQAARPFVLPEALPDNIASDYREAADLLAVSPAASAAFSRRCLQTILKHQDYKKSKLVSQIDDLLKETNPAKVVPHYITTRLDVRHFGNFSVHEIEDRATAEILDVEPGEAEWCLEIIEDLIEHYFVRPAAEQAKIDNLNAKLAGAGKPEIKTPPVAAKTSSDDP